LVLCVGVEFESQEREQSSIIVITVVASQNWNLHNNI